MKIGQTTKIEDDKLLIRNTHSATPALERARMMRDAGKQRMGESVAVGVVPFALICLWAKNAGVRLDDEAAMSELIDRELQNPDNAQFRVWEGRF